VQEFLKETEQNAELFKFAAFARWRHYLRWMFEISVCF